MTGSMCSIPLVSGVKLVEITTSLPQERQAEERRYSGCHYNVAYLGYREEKVTRKIPGKRLFPGINYSSESQVQVDIVKQIKAH